ncbi:MAG: response regulator [Hyphomicrobiales bacterium]|nr:MAG: response regulator [Hyphomicrobiales bacterium]
MRGLPMKKRVLVVEDNPDILDSMAEIIESEGFEVSKARNGAVALALLQQLDEVQERVDCIVLDYIMPEMDGQQFLERLHSPMLVAFKDVPVLVTTTNTIEFRQATTRPVEFLPKPVDVEELTLRIKTLTGR